MNGHRDGDRSPRPAKLVRPGRRPSESSGPGTQGLLPAAPAAQSESEDVNRAVARHSDSSRRSPTVTDLNLRLWARPGAGILIKGSKSASVPVDGVKPGDPWSLCHESSSIGRGQSVSPVSFTPIAVFTALIGLINWTQNQLETSSLGP